MMLSPQLIFPPNLSLDFTAGNYVNVGQEGGPQGNPNGTKQPRPYPTSDAVGNPNSFGMRLIPPPYGKANWVTALPFNNRIAEMVLSGKIAGLSKNPVPFNTF